MSKNTSTAGAENALSNLDPSGKDLRQQDNSVFRLDSLAPGAEGGADVLTSPKARLSHATIFFVVLVAVGLGLLFAMRRIGISPLSALAKMKEPDYDLTKAGKLGVGKDHTKVLADLSESTVKSQVPPDQVQKNPFKMGELAAGEPEDPTKGETERARKQAEIRRQQVDSAFANLKLHSLIGGSNPVARINDKAVRIGDTIDDYFSVAAITGRTVKLTCDGREFELNLDDDRMNPTGKPAPRKK